MSKLKEILNTLNENRNVRGDYVIHVKGTVYSESNKKREELDEDFELMTLRFFRKKKGELIKEYEVNQDESTRSSGRGDGLKLEYRVDINTREPGDDFDVDAMNEEMEEIAGEYQRFLEKNWRPFDELELN